MELSERAATEKENRFKYTFEVVEPVRMLKILKWRNKMFQYTDKTVDAFGAVNGFEAVLGYYCELNNYDGWMAKVLQDNAYGIEFEKGNYEFAILKKNIGKLKLASREHLGKKKGAIIMKGK